MVKMVQIMMWLEHVKETLKNERGQGMVEYGLILALVAVAVTVALTTMGTTISDKFTAITNSL